jgi:hypothetical protein
MSRCEGYYRVENRRCDREAVASVDRAGDRYALCAYHSADNRPVARWDGESDRRVGPAPLRRAA